jgi:hypothetical protein
MIIVFHSTRILKAYIFRMCYENFIQKTIKYISTKYVVSYITIHRYILVASVTNIRVSYKKTNNILVQTIAQNIPLKPTDVTVNILSSPYGHEMSNYVWDVFMLHFSFM